MVQFHLKLLCQLSETIICYDSLTLICYDNLTLGHLATSWFIGFFITKTANTLIQRVGKAN